jgi:RNA polymerase sigma factor (sigma-70 family)
LILENALISDAQAQERKPLSGDELYRAHVRPIYCFIYSKVGNRETAEDLTSDVFVRALSHLDPTREEHSIIAWLYRVARNLVTDYWRQGQSTSVIALDQVRNLRASTFKPDILRQDQTARSANDLLAMLPSNYRSVLQYRLIEGLSVAETAEKMSTSVANVKVLQHRALKRAAELRGSDTSV